MFFQSGGLGVTPSCEGIMTSERSFSPRGSPPASPQDHVQPQTTLKMQGKHFFGGLKLFYYFSIMGIRVVTNIQAPFPAGSLTARLPLIFHVSVIL